MMYLENCDTLQGWLALGFLQLVRTLIYEGDILWLHCLYYTKGAESSSSSNIYHLQYALPMDLCYGVLLY